MHQLNPKLKQVWLFRDCKKFDTLVPKYVKKAKYSTFNIIFHLATSKVWVDNDLSHDYLLHITKKNKKQLYIETWHGDRGLKKCFYHEKDYKPKRPFKIEEQGFCDYFLVGSTFAEWVVPGMFRYSGQLLKCGYPRNDILFCKDENVINAIKSSLGIMPQEKILLYAPTFRQDKLENADDIDFKAIIDVLEKKTNDKWVVVTRMHHQMRKAINIDKSVRCVDGSSYYDMAGLLLISDMLISDYSSCPGDFILRDKPVFLFVSDCDKYNNSDKGLEFELKDSPYMFAKTNKQLIKLIAECDDRKAKENCDALKRFYGCYERGIATETVCEIILNHLKKR